MAEPSAQGVQLSQTDAPPVPASNYQPVPTQGNTGNAEPQQQQEQQGHDRDKGLIQLQQRFSTSERQQEEFRDATSFALGNITNQLSDLSSVSGTANQSPPLAAQAQSQLDQIKVDLDDIVKSEALSDDEDSPTNKDFKGVVGQIGQKITDVAQQLQEQLGVSGTDSELSKLANQVNELQSNMAAQSASSDYWDKFAAKSDEGGHGYDGRPLWSEAWNEAVSECPDMSDQHRHGYAIAKFNTKVAAADTATGTSPTGVPPAMTPASTAGTQTVPLGSTGTTPTAQPTATQALPCWEPD